MSQSFSFRDEWLRDPSGSFTWRAALALVSASRLAYSDREAVQEIVEREWNAQATPFARGQSQGFVLENDRCVVIAFRGTDSVADWLGNIQILPEFDASLGGAVHGGFLEAYLRVADVVDAAFAGANGRPLWLTGHSLGGALAVIAAVTHRDRPIAGLMTFGQPLLLGRRPARTVNILFAQRYRRFVNRDDLVARVPPGYVHAGARVHLDSGGTVAVETAEGAPDDRSISSEEFVEIQATIDAVRVETGRSNNTDSTSVRVDVPLDTSVEGLIPGIAAHRIDAYVTEINARASAEINATGLHESFSVRRAIAFGRELAVAGETNFGFHSELELDGVMVAAEHEASYLVRLIRPEWTPHNGVELRALVGNIGSVRATQAGIENLRQSELVVSIEASHEAGGEEITQSVPHVRGTEIHNRPDVAERGDAALVGIIDTGIDILHQAFSDSAGDSRILAVWVQRDSTGPSPKTVDPAFMQDYGTLYLATDISRFRSAYHAASPGTMPALPPKGLRDEWSGHGTHVASIAAGRGFGTVGDGMAPEAGIVVVAAQTTGVPGDPVSIGYSSSHVEALAFLKRVAEGGTAISHAARPMAINVSLGMNAGAHDGLTTLEAAFDGVTGSGRIPGIAIIKSAGNEQGQAGHALAYAVKNGIVTVNWNTLANSRRQDYVEAWYPGEDQISFTLLTPDNQTVTVNRAAPLAPLNGVGYFGRVELTELHPDNGANRLAITITATPGRQIPSGTWSVDIVATQIGSKDPAVHFWAERDNSRSVQFVQPDPTCTLSIPSTANSVIAVGACNSTFPMRLFPQSSRGLTRDGRAKPDLCAPGIGIVAAQANGLVDSAVSLSGTSMAAPHVTGAVALAFSALSKAGKPLPNANQVRQMLRQTTQTFTHVHDTGFGSGILDAKEFFDQIV